MLNKGLSRIDIPIWISKGEEIRGLKALRGRWLRDIPMEKTDLGEHQPKCTHFPDGEIEVPHLQEYMWFFLTLLRKKPLQPSQLEAP